MRRKVSVKRAKEYGKVLAKLSTPDINEDDRVGLHCMKCGWEQIFSKDQFLFQCVAPSWCPSCGEFLNIGQDKYYPLPKGVKDWQDYIEKFYHSTTHWFTGKSTQKK